MARKKQQPEDQPRPGRNGFDSAALQGFVERIDRCYDDLATLRGEHMSRCRTVRQDIGAILDEAVAADIPRRALKDAIKARQLDQKIERLRDDMEAQDRETYDQIMAALGEFGATPLGQAAASKGYGAPDETRV